MSTHPPEQPTPAPAAPTAVTAPTVSAAGPAVSAAPATIIYATPPASRPRRFWNAVKNVSLLVSMIVNLVLIIVVVILLSQVGNIKLTLASVLGQLDSAFEGLGASTIKDSIAISQQVPVNFTLPLDQDTVVVTTAPVPINVPATFSLGPYGSINGFVSLSLTPGTQLPVHIRMTVPVSNSIPVVFNQPIAIPLAEKGLRPVVDKLRSAIGPLINIVEDLPDRFVILGFQ